MSVAGLKKQFNKVNQYMSEKIGGAKGTELDDKFTEMEKNIDVMGKLVDELMARTHELLQPNPASRAKLSAVKSISKMRGQTNAGLYPQPEGQLGECMIKHGRDLGDESLFGQALIESGETFRTLADIKYSLEDNVKQNFIEPLAHIQTKDLKEVNHHRKKMSGRRLDYDCKRRKREKVQFLGHLGSPKNVAHSPSKSAAVTEDELQMAEEKFEESKSLAETAMFNLLDNDVEQISALSSFIEAEAHYHRATAEALEALHSNLQDRVTEAANRPRKEHVPKRVASTLNINSDKSPGYNDIDHGNSHSAPSYSSFGSSKEDINTGSRDVAGNNTKTEANDPFGSWDTYGGTSSSYQQSAAGRGGGGSQPCAKALYDFEPENEGELGFKEGDIINLLERIDENWFEGSVNGMTGFFPVNYVDVIVPL